MPSRRYTGRSYPRPMDEDVVAWSAVIVVLVIVGLIGLAFIGIVMFGGTTGAP